MSHGSHSVALLRLPITDALFWFRTPWPQLSDSLFAEMLSITFLLVIQVEGKFILKLMVSRPVCPHVRKSSETRGEFLFRFYGNYINTAADFSLWSSSLAGGWVFNLQLLLGLASAILLRSKSRGTRDHILLSSFKISST
jgi:hypothetical protein